MDESKPTFPRWSRPYRLEYSSNPQYHHLQSEIHIMPVCNRQWWIDRGEPFKLFAPYVDGPPSV